ncbi:MAG: ABC transporter ATP-binding protein [Chloroflexi bacterium]|nr:ABC transporter ATP-binding protein [Chloroflexota bacterium]
MVVGSEPVALLGRNDMGKTTLCQSLMGLLPIAQGDVFFEGNKLTGHKPYQIASLGIGYVPQGRRIFPSLSVHEHMLLLSGSKNQSKRRWTVESIYELFPRLAERRKVSAGALSGGEQQMLAIARALLTNARLLIMDEPSEGLAPSIVDHLLETLKRLSAEGIGMLVVEQKLSVAAALANHMLIMVAGRIALETSTSAFLANEDAKRRYLGVGKS